MEFQRKRHLHRQALSIRSLVKLYDVARTKCRKRVFYFLMETSIQRFFFYQRGTSVSSRLTFKRRESRLRLYLINPSATKLPTEFRKTRIHTHIPVYNFISQWKNRPNIFFNQQERKTAAEKILDDIGSAWRPAARRAFISRERPEKGPTSRGRSRVHNRPVARWINANKWYAYAVTRSRGRGRMAEATEESLVRSLGRRCIRAAAVWMTDRCACMRVHASRGRPVDTPIHPPPDDPLPLPSPHTAGDYFPFWMIDPGRADAIRSGDASRRFPRASPVRLLEVDCDRFDRHAEGESAARRR